MDTSQHYVTDARGESMEHAQHYEAARHLERRMDVRTLRTLKVAGKLPGA